MYLKSIEIHGFKSFANKIVLEFNDGITGIVGPNGSGKSNVADAVRWVLGEQSAKQLRGSKMEDIIFSGTQTRKPLGYAFVAITLNNSDHKLAIDYDEVTVARRVYRSGESEYLINGASCRLKDVQELFMDTGIGKEGYSIIGQGQIDKILSGKPEDRRELFDEAAGIVKFKRRKASAEKNLAEERINLSRVADIMTEIEKQLDPLEKQSAVAKVYLKYREDLKALEVAQFLMEYDKIRTSKDATEEKLVIANTALDQAKIDYENTKEEYLRLEKELEECDRSIEGDKNLYNEVMLKKEKAEGEIKVLKEQISSLGQNDTYYQSRVEAGERDIQAKKNEEQGYISEKAVIDGKIADLDDLLTTVSTKLANINENIRFYTEEIEECNNGIFEFLNVNSQVKGSIQRYETMLEQNTVRKAELNQKILKSKSEEDAYNITIEKHRENLQVVSQDIIRLTEERTGLEGGITASQKTMDTISLEFNDIQNHYHREKSRLESLINLTERYEGYGNSIKKVMEQKTRIPGILGVVADIIKTDKEYETAIETALGGQIQNVITRDEDSAKKLITYLKQNKFGRATFLPLTNISSGNGFTNEKALKEMGVIGLASSLVEADSQFRSLMDYLLGRILVVDNIDNATIIAKKYHYSLRIVTLEGELLTPGGSISGGTYRNASNLLGRRREVEELEDEVKTLESRLKGLSVDREEERAKRAGLRQQLEDVKIQLQEEFIKQNTAKMSLNQEISKKAETQTIYHEHAKELQEIELQAGDLKEKLRKLNLELEGNLSKNKEKEALIDEINGKLQSERIISQETSEQVASLKMELSSLEQNNQFIMENVRRVKREMDRLFEEQSQLMSDIRQASEASQAKQQAVEDAKVMIEALGTSCKDLEAKIKIQVQAREEITKIHKNFFTKRDELSVHMNDLDKEVFRLNSQREKLIEQADQQMNYMWEEYELTYITAKDYPITTDISLTQAKKSIQEIKSNIRELGDVNVNAIEDFKNLSERFEFLTVQSQDLIKSEEALLGIIEELDMEMRKTFAEKFAAINEQFDLVFKELFGGGKADLELTDGEDILEAGIRINGQPPGKKLQNMMQLSGGEKALTAISLLFAIQNLKPSPFCLLDEIEAALDDSNVKRFANYLNKLSKDTQFIIITHRRGTMAAADSLYGITMQEKGISTLVGVSLIENELDI